MGRMLISLVIIYPFFSGIWTRQIDSNQRAGNFQHEHKKNAMLAKWNTNGTIVAKSEEKLSA